MRVWRVKRKIYWSDSFDSAHFLILPYSSKCLNIHGHEYKVEVEIEGQLDDNGMIFDFNHLKTIVKKLDHAVIVPKDAIKFEQGLVEVETLNGSKMILNKGQYIVIEGNATAENIAEYIAGQIVKNANDNIEKVKVKVWEDSRSYAEIELNNNH